MVEQVVREQKFDLSQNSFVIFILSYAPGLITGAIIIAFLGSFLPRIVEEIAFVLLFIGMLIKAIMDLQLNKRTLVVSEKSIMVYLKKRKNNILLQKINNEEIESIKQIEKEAFTITKKDGTEELIALSSSLKPYKTLLYSVKLALFKVYGENRTDFMQDEFFANYIKTKALPQKLLKEDKDYKISRTFLVILCMILAGIPSILSILAILIIILSALIVFLKGILAIL